MRAHSFFTGIAGFDLGFARAGITTLTQVEWNEHCRQVLRRHFPAATLLEDINDVTAAQLPPADVWSGGFPCQGTSLGAPHRLGLADPRSQHFWEFARVIDEGRPEWVVLENPVGLLKSNRGWDAAAVFGVLGDLGYGWAYRVVDARFLGTTQRRERVLVVGHSGGDPRPAWDVLGDPDGGEEAAPPRRERRGTIGPAPAGGAAFDAVWRKSARARASLAAGGYETWVSDGKANTLTGFDGGGPARQTHLVAQQGRLRTLTFTEWERLQGFPDGWTEGLPESARFTALGNAIPVGVAEWLGRRLVAVNERISA